MSDGTPDDRTRPPPPPARRKYVPAVGPRLKKLLFVVFGLFALLAVNSAYLVAVTVLEAATGQHLPELVLPGDVPAPPGAGAADRRAGGGVRHRPHPQRLNRPNRRAVRVGLALFATALVLLVTGIVLTRIEGVIEVKDPAVRARRLLGARHHAAAGGLAVRAAPAGRAAHQVEGRPALGGGGRRCSRAVMLVAAGAGPAAAGTSTGPKSGEQYFFPSLARTATGNFIPAAGADERRLLPEVPRRRPRTAGSDSVHRFSSFNNPAYLFSVRETREVSLEARRQRAGVALVRRLPRPGAVLQRRVRRPEVRRRQPPDRRRPASPAPSATRSRTSTARAATPTTPSRSRCTTRSPTATTALLQWVNHQLVKAKPEFHKKTFLKPFHKTAEFCSTCHKVHLPAELNHYKEFLRGQNHYDTFLLQRRLGPRRAAASTTRRRRKANCNGCHMPLRDVRATSARSDFDGTGELQRPQPPVPGGEHRRSPRSSAWPPEAIAGAPEVQRRRDARRPVRRAARAATIDGELHRAAAARRCRRSQPGQSYLLEAVIRTLKMGHPFTQGTADSNEVWLDVDGDERRPRDRPQRRPAADDGEVDPWSHFVNVYMLDRDGNRIDRRNPQDIFTPLYNHQIPPGAAEVVHYRLDVPRRRRRRRSRSRRSCSYRKFDTTTCSTSTATDFDERPADHRRSPTDRVTFPVARRRRRRSPNADVADRAEWQRWNDYGIGLLLKGGKTQGRAAPGRGGVRARSRSWAGPTGR